MANDVEVRRETNPINEFDAMNDFDRVFDRFLGTRSGGLFGDWPVLSQPPVPAQLSALSLQETDDGYILSADVP